MGIKLKDFVFFACLVLLFVPFFVSKEIYTLYMDTNKAHPFILAFIKFAILATAGECIGLRIKEGVYNKKGFGILPRAIVWGFLGISIYIAFTIFRSGGIVLAEKIGIADPQSIYSSPNITIYKIAIAFIISSTMNLFYAPVLMTFHKITDIHIESNGGTFIGLFKPIKFIDIFPAINWKSQWDFVFKKTIPLFWIPAQTINFLLPQEFNVLIAALLGIVLGVIMAIASIKAKS